ncbi:MAG TPA: hypothetical protein VFW21_10295, partial [Mycobacterium sp.]|nr:hypothetical protein [Mycobacterium sp.]
LAEPGRFSSWITDHHTVGVPGATDMAHLPRLLSSVLADELSGAAGDLGVTPDEILLAAFGRAISRTIGDGLLSVDLDTGNWSGRGALSCAGPGEMSAAELLATVCAAVRVAAAPAPGTPTDIRLCYRSADAHPVNPEAGTGTGSACLLALHATHDDAGQVVLDWWYDARGFAPYTVEELAEQFPLALVEIASEAVGG